jgi:hypothetical protein
MTVIDAPVRQAVELLQEVTGSLWDGESLPVPVEAIADTHFRLLIRDRPPAAMGEAKGAPEGGLSGLLLVHEREIWVNAEEGEQWPGRRRFTIGHELGHWCMHRPLGSLFCRAVNEPGPKPDIEEEASQFSSALLFPPALLRAHHAEAGGELAVLCERFGASRVATERAVFAVLRRPLIHDGVSVFAYDDEGYLAWRAAHREDGYVLNDSLDAPDTCRLHRAACSYLDRAATPERPHTRAPKWCALQAGILRDVMPGARDCSRCRP